MLTSVIFQVDDEGYLQPGRTLVRKQQASQNTSRSSAGYGEPDRQLYTEMTSPKAKRDAGEYNSAEEIQELQKVSSLKKMVSRTHIFE